MTTPFNLPSLDSAYNLSVLQQLSQQQKFQQQHQAVEATVVPGVFANPNSLLPPQQQQAVAQLAYLYNSSTDNCSTQPPSAIQHAFLYNPTAYPSPPLDASTALPSSRMNTNDSGDHHHHGNTDNNQNYHSGPIITDNSQLNTTSQPSFNADQKPPPPQTIPTITSEGYQTASSYPAAPQYQPPMDRRAMIPIHHPAAKIEPGTSEGTSETWTRIPETAGTSYSFGQYATKPAKGFDERALDPFFAESSMKIPTGSSTAPPMGYFNPGSVGYDRNGIPHSVNFGNAMPTPQDYPMPIAAMQNQGGNGARSTTQFTQNRPSVPAPQTMMTTFSSKTVSSTPKRYKCNICQKRFTRPSSLQTHTYSHTGEKPFKCPVEGCGRHFSVVSNLRRHQKIHTK